MSPNAAMLRRARILERVSGGQACHVTELAKAFGVSEMTVRRDLDALAATGRIVRTHGGAVSGGGVIFEFRFLERAAVNRPAKRAIAERAAALVEDGAHVLLDSGTTTLEVARALRTRRDLTVITTSLPIASELQYNAGIQVILLGGRVRRDSPDLSGALTLRTLDTLRADIAILGADAVDRQGNCYHGDIEVAHLVAAMTAIAERIYVVADSSKLGRRALGRMGRAAGWAGLITDAGAAPAMSRALKRNGVHLIKAQTAPDKQPAERKKRK
jgi:DeoR family transcriptional regulator, fructose operon transcriptional repressor